MGSGGVRASCQSTLCILSGIALGLAILCLLCGGILYGVSKTFTAISNTHLVNRTTASNFTKGIDSKLDHVRTESAEKGASMLEKAHQLFYAAGAFGIACAALLALSCMVACKSRPALAPPITSDPFAPAPEVEPAGEGAPEDGATSPAPPAGSPLPPGSPVPPAGSPPPPGSPVPPAESPAPERAASPPA